MIINPGDAFQLLKLCKKHNVKVVRLYHQNADSRTNKDEFLTGPGWCLGMVIQWFRYSQAGRDKEFWENMDSNEMETAFRLVMARQILPLQMRADKLKSVDEFINKMAARLFGIINRKNMSFDEALEILTEEYRQDNPHIPLLENEIKAIKEAYEVYKISSEDSKNAVTKMLTARGFVKSQASATKFPFVKKDEEKLLDAALSSAADHININLFSSEGAHSCALRRYNNDKYAFMDPNGGEFLFDNRAQLNAYIKDYFKLLEYDQIKFYEFNKYSYNKSCTAPNKINELFLQTEVPTQNTIEALTSLLTDANIEKIRRNDPEFTVLNLCDLTLNQEKWEQLTEALRHNNRLQEINLNNCNLEFQAVKRLCEALANNPALAVICLGGNRLRERDVGKVLADLIEKHSSLEGLDLRDCYLGVEELAHLIPVLEKNTSLKRISLAGNDLNTAAAEQLALALAGKGLLTLNLKKNRIDNPDKIKQIITDENVLFIKEQIESLSPSSITRLSESNMFSSPTCPALIKESNPEKNQTLEEDVKGNKLK
jgi:hypothetical protein